MTDYSILTRGFPFWHRAKPQLVSSLIPEADSVQEALRHLEAEFSNLPAAEAGGAPVWTQPTSVRLPSTCCSWS